MTPKEKPKRHISKRDKLQLFKVACPQLPVMNPINDKAD